MIEFLEQKIYKEYKAGHLNRTVVKHFTADKQHANMA